jgi:hypothetical protein
MLISALIPVLHGRCVLIGSMQQGLPTSTAKIESLWHRRRRLGSEVGGARALANARREGYRE